MGVASLHDIIILIVVFAFAISSYTTHAPPSLRHSIRFDSNLLKSQQYEGLCRYHHSPHRRQRRIRYWSPGRDDLQARRLSLAEQEWR